MIEKSNGIKNILNGEIKMKKNYIECISNEPFDCKGNFPDHFQAPKKFWYFCTQTVTSRMHTYTLYSDFKLKIMRVSSHFEFFELAKKKLASLWIQLERCECLVICWTKKINFITFACHSKFVSLTWPFWAPVHLILQYLWHFFSWNSEKCNRGSV